MLLAPVHDNWYTELSLTYKIQPNNTCNKLIRENLSQVCFRVQRKLP